MVLHLKKSLGQHFLKDERVLMDISDSVGDLSNYKTAVEVGPGMGALTKLLLAQKHPDFHVVELDDRWAEHLSHTFPPLRGKIIHQDFLKVDLSFIQNPGIVIGNFPYNISSQIIFKLLDYRNTVECITGMFQKEVALRIASPHGNKNYGVLSVLSQAYYSSEYLFSVFPEAFTPPPKVMSGVIRMSRREIPLITGDEIFFKRVVKAAFNQRRKTLRNSLKEVVVDKAVLIGKVFDLRPEQLSVSDFNDLANELNPSNK